MLSSIKLFIKQECVLCIASILAIISCFFVPINNSYMGYIDFRVLALLFCLMLIVAGFKYVDFFYLLSENLFKLVNNLRSIVVIFICLCFFSSMLITNDVALILFVPFSIFSLKKHLSQIQLIVLVVLETVAANLGSIVTPIGNPQNLFLFSFYNVSLRDFFATMLPYAICSFLLLLCCTLFFKGNSSKEFVISSSPKKNINYALHYFCYSGLFILAISTVVRIIPYQVTLIICLIVIFFLNKRLFLEVDYCLLLTFVAFFIFVGNLGEISVIKDFITDITFNNEVAVSIISSQFISNVPAALLLSGFTSNGTALLIGTNIGGLGTIIASMASLISYKFYATQKDSNIPLYFAIFTVVNIIFLIVLLALTFALHL